MVAFRDWAGAGSTTAASGPEGPTVHRHEGLLLSNCLCWDKETPACGWGGRVSGVDRTGWVIIRSDEQTLSMASSEARWVVLYIRTVMKKGLFVIGQIYF